MTEPLSPPPPICWLRVVLTAAGAVYLGCALVFPNDTFAIGHLAVLSVAPFALLFLTWRKWRGPVGEPAEAGRLRFRRFWTWVWLVAALASTALFAFGKGWQSDSGMALRLSLALLLLWTSLLLPAMWGVFRALGRREFWRAVLRQSLFAAAVLVTLIALFYAEENWRGRRAWERFRAEWEAKGVKFTFAEALPPPVPDEENVAMHPLFKPMFDYTRDPKAIWTGAVWRDTNAMQRLHNFTAYPASVRRTFRGNLPGFTSTQERTNGVAVADWAAWQHYLRHDTNFAATLPAPTPAEDVLRYLSRHDPLVNELDEALRRPHCRFPIRYDSEPPDRTMLPHLGPLRSIAVTLTIRAAAAVEAGRPDAALRDLERIYQVVALLDSDPFAISLLVRISVYATVTGAIAQGTVGHRWPESHLQRLDAMLAPLNVLQAYEANIRPNVAALAELFAFHRKNREELVELYAYLADSELHPNHFESFAYKKSPTLARFVLRAAPAGWIYRLQTKEAEGHLQHANPAFVNAVQRRVTWSAQPQSAPRLWFERWWPLPGSEYSMTKAAAKSARIQTTLHHARLAIALERHWLRHRAYPERLDALVPAFLDRLPHDLFDGQPMRYRREGEQGFVLWSIGFDGKDDSAAPLLPKPSGTTHVGEETGDLVWRYPQ